MARHDDLTRVERAVDGFVAYFGSLRFIAWQTAVIVAWVTFNVVALEVWRWDPYPFILLNLVFSTQSAYAAPLILLSQNRQAEHDRIKAEHDYFVNEESLRLLRLLAPAETAVAEALAQTAEDVA